jgi:hypothetical protein
MFQNRKIAIATMHGKEKVISPLLEQYFNASCYTVEGLNTDVLGTFTGEIERVDSPINTLRKKCLMALEKSNHEIVIGSEGSFGAHPIIGFARANEELVMLIDIKNNIEIVGSSLSLQTNFNGVNVVSLAEAIEFSKLSLFPSHALIIRNKERGSELIYKGITQMIDFKERVTDALHRYRSIWIETDMRAHLNPSRLAVIKEATADLINKMKSNCPSCAVPGFWIAEVNKGLPCSLCKLPTNSTLSHQYICVHCNFEQEQLFPNDRKEEDPMFCNFCNP